MGNGVPEGVLVELQGLKPVPLHRQPLSLEKERKMAEVLGGIGCPLPQPQEVVLQGGNSCCCVISIQPLPHLIHQGQPLEQVNQGHRVEAGDVGLQPAGCPRMALQGRAFALQSSSQGPLHMVVQAAIGLACSSGSNQCWQNRLNTWRVRAVSRP